MSDMRITEAGQQDEIAKADYFDAPSLVKVERSVIHCTNRATPNRIERRPYS